MSNYGTRVQLLAATRIVTSEDGLALGDECSDTPDSEQLIEYASRVCVAKEEDLGKRSDYIQDRIKQGHESVIEHASLTFEIWCSRVVTHELVRHRIASYSQRSQRYVKETEPRYITPPELALPVVPDGEPESMSDFEQRVLGQKYIRHMEACWDLYCYYLSKGVPREIARYVLPNACETRIVCTWNYRECRHIIRLRTSKRALPEMQEVAGKVRDICKLVAPKVFADI